ncbi:MULTISPECIES: HesB/IscA family protein [Vibrio]|uniref:HesB/IscA family protein n=1 Tax=Vibrio TaxID=662 RepID=UPI00093278BC|nr:MULTISPECIES: iron-sulfur cluster assembly accessory protein [Vibrio]PXA74803.1 iron-sulfur cluster assembly accessory protein [Vibrio sp. 11986-1-5]
MQVETYTPEVSNQAVLTLTDSAIRHLEAKLAKQPDHVLRVSIKTSGCNGYAYVLELQQQTPESDLALKITDTLTVKIAQDAIPMLHGSQMDYVKEGLNGVLKFNNPNVVGECGCGESFNVS